MIFTRYKRYYLVLLQWIFGITLTPLLLTGCGQKGDLYLPPSEPVQAQQTEDAIDANEEDEEESKKKTLSETDSEAQ